VYPGQSGPCRGQTWTAGGASQNNQWCYNLAIMRNSELNANHLTRLKALASEPRLQVLEWLKNPAAHFPPQKDGDFVEDGVCADYIREKLGIAAATASRHLTLLADAQLLIATRKKGWVFYRRNEAGIAQFGKDLGSL
jgi:DNA-binding transcriptional ArsR family regulator